MRIAESPAPSPHPLTLRAKLARIPPPPAYAAALLLGLFLGHEVPLALVPQALAAPARVLAIALLVSGGALALGCLGLFAMRRTTIVPHRRAAALVTSGPYRVSRNPMYVSLTLLYLGVALLQNALWPVLLLALPTLLMAAVHIPFEERLLGEAFGEEYRRYAGRVRRWL